jgi:hypothetical protein
MCPILDVHLTTFVLANPKQPSSVWLCSQASSLLGRKKSLSLHGDPHLNRKHPAFYLHTLLILKKGRRGIPSEEKPKHTVF